MPKRDDIKKILLLGSGPIVIGQACEFDYSGVQACKVLKEEGFELVLVNSNPATIMTDPEFADRTYIEPLTCEILHEIIRRERPDAILPTLGGQTALNLAIELYEKNILERYNVEILGASPESIEKAEDRALFKKAMTKINLKLAKSVAVHSMDEAMQAIETLGDFPVILRPGFTLGGTGGGIAYNMEEYKRLMPIGLDYSPTSEVLVEESILGWKEFELEVMRDKNDNVVIICSIENIDPMGIHTGDSVTVAPAQTLTDREYQLMRDASINCMREIGVETGGSNVQFAINPDDGRMIIIEMNPRVSRSSALASKATGFPIAKFAAKLAIGYTLDEIMNDITLETPACFEPSIDYVVTKIPRFTFEKFPSADNTLTTQMKSVGETMSIGTTFKESFQKAMRSLETGRAGFGADGKDTPFENASDEKIKAELIRPNALRFFYLREALKRNWSCEKIYELTNINPWFLRNFEELANYEEEIKQIGSLKNLKNDLPFFRQTKEFGYSDKQLAFILSATEDEVRTSRKKLNIIPTYGLVDTCAAEFEAYTPYYYSTYGKLEESQKTQTEGKKKVMILGGGPNRIGQGIEFDYCCVHASFALRDAGFETIMVNSNPETVSTDYDISDKLYFEPLTLEDVLHIYEKENCWGVIVQFGGQTPLNLAADLERNGVNIIGTSPKNIEAAEDRRFFQELANKIGVRQPKNATVSTVDEAAEVAGTIGYPVLLRPSFVLGGRGMVIAYNEKFLRKYMKEAVEVSEDRPVLIDRFLEAAIEVDVDCISDGETCVIGAIMEHVEQAGIHSGDSACMIPPVTLSEKVLKKIKEYSVKFAEELQVYGLMNIQYAIQDEEVYIIEVNPRASRTIPFVSKTIGIPLAKLASLVMTGTKLKDLGFINEIIPRHYAAKEAVLPFVKFPGTDVLLSPEMKSTGEVMGIDTDPGIAFLKTQIAAGNSIPTSGNIFISVRNNDKEKIIEPTKKLVEMGFKIFATKGTATLLRENGIPANAIFKISGGRPNVLDMIEENNVQWIVNTPSGGKPMVDEVKMRAETVIRGVLLTTTVSGMKATVEGINALRDIKRMEVCSIQEFHRHAPDIQI
ncbi:MAG: carbamoyl-phosphate synthase large subunit [Verrucomicrobiota bacterium]|nr:carbamoyl-phosphate synthase large subunit [Verrucomicrobiota bacterium]